MIPTTLLALSSLSGAALALAASTPRVLIYSATEQFRHDSIPTAVQALKDAGGASSGNGSDSSDSAGGSGDFAIAFDSTEDGADFTDDNLRGYDALVFLSTTGEVLDDAGKDALQNYLNLGGNFIGIHSATDCLNTTEFYGREIGAYFDYHPELTNATIDVVDSSHPSTSMLPQRWQVRDEMYNFKSDPRDVGAVVILSADESTYEDPGERKYDQGTPHPTAWCQDKGAGAQSGHPAGRSFYTSLGHLNETWHDALFMAHVMGGIRWALEANTTRAFNGSAAVGNGEGGGDVGGSSEGGASSSGSGSDGGAVPTQS
ncbi:trehalose utilization-domain-containing protein [Schizophyllum fasciatum]